MYHLEGFFTHDQGLAKIKSVPIFLIDLLFLAPIYTIMCPIGNAMAIARRGYSVSGEVFDLLEFNETSS